MRQPEGSAPLRHLTQDAVFCMHADWALNEQWVFEGRCPLCFERLDRECMHGDDHGHCPCCGVGWAISGRGNEGWQTWDIQLFPHRYEPKRGNTRRLRDGLS